MKKTFQKAVCWMFFTQQAKRVLVFYFNIYFYVL